MVAVNANKRSNANEKLLLNLIKMLTKERDSVASKTSNLEFRKVSPARHMLLNDQSQTLQPNEAHFSQYQANLSQEPPIRNQHRTLEVRPGQPVKFSQKKLQPQENPYKLVQYSPKATKMGMFSGQNTTSTSSLNNLK